MFNIRELWWMLFFTTNFAVPLKVPFLEEYQRSSKDFENLNHVCVSIKEDELTDLISSNYCQDIGECSFLEHNSYFEALFVNKNRITTVANDFFSSTPNITFLSLARNVFQKFEESTFNNLRNLTFLDFAINRLQELSPNIFANLYLLRVLDLSSNELTTLPENIFINNINLRAVDIATNHLLELPMNLFIKNANLNTLYLFDNKLQDLPENLFHSSKSLINLDLSSNKLTKINCSIFAGLDFLRYVNLSTNKLSVVAADPLITVKSLETLNLSNNKISDSSYTREIFRNVFTIFPNLRKLNLGSNELEYIQDLIDNFISHLRPLRDPNSTILTSSSEELEADFILSLENNEIRDIDLHDYAEYITKHNSNHYIWKLELHNNHLQCSNCHLYDVLRYANDLLNSSLRIQKHEDNFCLGSNQYEKIRFSQVNTEEYMCTLPENKIVEKSKCPNECNLKIRLFDKMITFDCKNKSFFAAPKTLCSFDYQGYMIELDLTRNQITDFPHLQQIGYDRVANLFLSYNNISTIPQDVLFNHRLKILKLDNNQLKTFSADTINEISLFIESIELGNNPWKCDCEVLDFHEFLLTKNITKDGDEIICETSNILLKNLLIHQLCPYYNFYYVITAFILAVLLTISFLYHFKRDIKIWLYAHNLCLWIVTEEELDKDKLYDAFVSYSHKDEEFVVDQLVSNLEEGPKSFKLCLHFRDWTAGEYIPTQIVNSIRNSKRTIVVLSPNFLESDWGRTEFKTAHKEAFEEGRVRLVVVLYGDIGPIDDVDPDLKSYLKMNTFVKWGDPWFWDKLRYALPHNSNLSEILIKEDLGRVHPTTQVQFNRAREVDQYSEAFVNLLNGNTVESR